MQFKKIEKTLPSAVTTDPVKSLEVYRKGKHVGPTSKLNTIRFFVFTIPMSFFKVAGTYLSCIMNLLISYKAEAAVSSPTINVTISTNPFFWFESPAERVEFRIEL